MRRDAADPTGLGIYPQLGLLVAGQPPHPLQPRLGRSRRQAVEPSARSTSSWNGSRWVGGDVPDYRARPSRPTSAVGPFIMNQEGTARLFARGAMPDGPFPEHYEPIGRLRSPIRCIPRSAAIRWCACSRPIAKSFGTPDKFPIVATSYRLTEHFHYWTKNVHDNAVLQPEHVRRDGRAAWPRPRASRTATGSRSRASAAPSRPRPA